MFLFKTIILFAYLTLTVKGNNTNIKCPRFCKCDSYLQLNRAQCSSKNLINAEVDLPHQVQILDLSYNDITTVDNKCFTNFNHLKYLYLSKNALHTLEWNAFFKLRRLTEIDLSHNRLEYLDERLFVKNKFLNKINLEGNKLSSLQNKPLIWNSFVEELILKNSQLNMLQSELFAGLTNLKQLDLSRNLLNNFNIEDFRHLSKLQKLNLNENFIKCDAFIKNKLKQLEKRAIHVAMDNCLNETYSETNKTTKMFEKMIMMTQGTTESSTINQWHLNLESEDLSTEEYDSDDDDKTDFKKFIVDSSSSNEWLRFNPKTILCNQQNLILCQEYRSCLQDLNKVWHEQRLYKDKRPLNDIKFALLIGIAIGASAIVVILACALCMKRCLKVKNAAPSTATLDDLPSQPLARPTTQLPPQVRRQPRRRPTRSTQSMLRYEGPVTENFLSRLFGRPARRQYYRTINQNTATLIRRLSRSNLFNNRLSQHFVDRQASVEATYTEVPDHPTASAPRPETPPPSYGDLLINNFNAAK